MTNSTQSGNGLDLEARTKDFNLLRDINLMRKFMEKPEDSKYHSDYLLKRMGNKISNDLDPNYLINKPTSAGINQEINDHSATKARDVQEAIENQKEFLINEYTKGVNEGIIAKSRDEVNENIQLEEGLDQETRQRIIDSEIKDLIYKRVGAVLTGLDINEDYDADVKEAYTHFKNISKLKGKEREDYVRDVGAKIIDTPNSANLLNYQDPAVAGRLLNMFAKKIGKKFLQETGTGYELNQAELENAFGNSGSYLEMAGIGKNENDELKLRQELAKE